MCHSTKIDAMADGRKLNIVCPLPLTELTGFNYMSLCSKSWDINVDRKTYKKMYAVGAPNSLFSFTSYSS